MAALGVVMSWMPEGREIPLPQPQRFGRREGTDPWPSRRTHPAQPPLPVNPSG
jgi:hypothetical protein